MKKEIQTLENHDQNIDREENRLEVEVSHVANPEGGAQEAEAHADTTEAPIESTPPAAPTDSAPTEEHHEEHHDEHHDEHHEEHHDHHDGDHHEGDGHHHDSQGTESHESNTNEGQHQEDRSGPPSGGVDPADPTTQGAPK